MAIEKRIILDKKITDTGIFFCDIEVKTEKFIGKGQVVFAKHLSDRTINTFMANYSLTELGVSDKKTTKQTIQIRLTVISYHGEVMKNVIQQWRTLQESIKTNTIT